MTDNGHIKLHRKMLKWEWYDDINTKVLFLHCLLKANWQPTKWHGLDLQAGQFVTSLANLAKETTLTVRQVRTALEHLISTNEVTSKCQGKIRIITVNSWNDYQGNDKRIDKQATSKRQGGDKIATTDEEYKEDKEGKNIYINNNIYPSNFDEFWKCYPRKQDKGQAYKCYQARLNDGYTAEQLLTACKNYAAECEKENREKKYIKVGSTFLSANEPFLDYLKGGSGEDGGNSRELAEQAERDKDKYYEEYFKSDRYKNAEMPFV